MEHFDVAVVGAGAVGCAIARELSKRELSCVVLEPVSYTHLDVYKRQSYDLSQSGVAYRYADCGSIRNP